MLSCPNCGDGNTKVLDSRPSADRIQRRRRCLCCQYRWTTYEIDADVYRHLMEHSRIAAMYEWAREVLDSPEAIQEES